MTFFTQITQQIRPAISYVFNLNAKWPIKSWSTNYKKKSSFNCVKCVKKKKIFFASSRFRISGPNTSRNDKNIPCSPHFHLSWQFCRTTYRKNHFDCLYLAKLKLFDMQYRSQAHANDSNGPTPNFSVDSVKAF